MENTLKNIIARLEKGSGLEISNQNFSNEILLDEYLQCTILYQVNLRRCRLYGELKFIHLRIQYFKTVKS